MSEEYPGHKCRGGLNRKHNDCYTVGNKLIRGLYNNRRTSAISKLVEFISR